MVPDQKQGYSQLSGGNDEDVPPPPPAYADAPHRDDLNTTLIDSAPYPPQTSLSTLVSPPKPTNQISIVNKHSPGTIEGEWMIDTSVVVPNGLLERSSSPLASVVESFASLFKVDGLGCGDAGKRNVNAFFANNDGTINLKLHIKGGGTAVIGVENKGRAARGVKIAIPTRDPNTTLSLSVHSGSSIRISLPSDFNGLIKGGTHRGQLAFSPALQSRTRIFSIDQGKPEDGRYFIGSWDRMTSTVTDGSQGPSVATTASSSSSRISLDSGWKGDTLNLLISESYEAHSIHLETWEERCEIEALEASKRAARQPWGTRVLRASREVFRVHGICMGTCFGCVKD